MDALCLFETLGYRVVGVNASWSRLFGYPADDARALTALDLLVTPDELRAVVVRSKTSGLLETAGRGLWRRADGSQFSADYTLGLYTVGTSALACLLVEELPIADWGSRPSLATLDEGGRGPEGEGGAQPLSLEEETSDTGAPTILNDALRDRIARTSRQQEALIHLSGLADADFDDLVRQILEVDSETLDVDRVSYWSISPAGDSIVCESLFDRSRGTGASASGAELFARDYGSYFRALKTGTLVPSHDALNDPRTAELAERYLKPLGIGALLDVPVYLRGELVGAVCHEHVGDARGWTIDEQQFAMSIGQMLSIALAARHREETTASLRQRDVMLAEAHAVLDRALRPGDGRLTGRMLGRYHSGQLIGRGGMGEVYRAIHVDDGSAVAIKLLHAASLDNPDHVQRFFREARVTAAVPSEHVARVFDVGKFDEDLPYIAMEILEGHDLGWHLRRAPQLQLDQVVELVDHAARALGAVRDAGVVHRDLKPSNLFLVDALPRAWKVLDFGLSRAATDPFTTTSDELVGTPAYMAPEQIRGDEADHRTDLYALAAIAYRALAGRPPFVGELPGVLYSVLTDPLPPLASLVRGVPVDVELVLVIALAKDPGDRFPSVERFAEALRQAATGALDDVVRAWGWALVKRQSGQSTG